MVLDVIFGTRTAGLVSVREAKCSHTQPQHLRNATQYRLSLCSCTSSMLVSNLWPHRNPTIFSFEASDSFTRSPASDQNTEG
jgi:hypothetical protein